MQSTWNGKNILVIPQKSALTFIQGIKKKTKNKSAFVLNKEKTQPPSQDITKIPVSLQV